MFLLILDSLGNSELLVILVAALIFFGPRKLPQLSRTVGKSLTDFRRASEDFKRTWAQEVAMEGDDRKTIAIPSIATVDRSMPDNTVNRETITPPSAESLANNVEPISDDPNDALATANPDEAREPIAEPLRKQDWL